MQMFTIVDMHLVRNAQATRIPPWPARHFARPVASVTPLPFVPVCSCCCFVFVFIIFIAFLLTWFYLIVGLAMMLV
jgi:hypothetical protein